MPSINNTSDKPKLTNTEIAIIAMNKLIDDPSSYAEVAEELGLDDPMRDYLNPLTLLIALTRYLNFGYYAIDELTARQLAIEIIRHVPVEYKKENV